MPDTRVLFYFFFFCVFCSVTAQLPASWTFSELWSDLSLWLCQNCHALRESRVYSKELNASHVQEWGLLCNKLFRTGFIICSFCGQNSKLCWMGSLQHKLFSYCYLTVSLLIRLSCCLSVLLARFKTQLTKLFFSANGHFSHYKPTKERLKPKTLCGCGFLLLAATAAAAAGTEARLGQNCGRFQFSQHFIYFTPKRLKVYSHEKYIK